MADEQLAFGEAGDRRADILIQEAIIVGIDFGGAGATDDLGGAVASDAGVDSAHELLGGDQDDTQAAAALGHIQYLLGDRAG